MSKSTWCGVFSLSLPKFVSLLHFSFIFFIFAKESVQNLITLTTYLPTYFSTQFKAFTKLKNLAFLWMQKRWYGCVVLKIFRQKLSVLLMGIRGVH